MGGRGDYEDNLMILCCASFPCTKYRTITLMFIIVNIRQELEISGIQDVRLKYKQNWINHLERMDNTRLLKQALTYKSQGRRDSACPRKQWQRVNAGTGQTT